MIESRFDHSAWTIGTGMVHGICEDSNFSGLSERDFNRFHVLF